HVVHKREYSRFSPAAQEQAPPPTPPRLQGGARTCRWYSPLPACVGEGWAAKLHGERGYTVSASTDFAGTDKRSWLPSTVKAVNGCGASVSGASKRLCAVIVSAVRMRPESDDSG